MLFNSSRGSDAEECCEKDNGCCSCCCCGCCLSRGDADWSSAGVDIDAGTSNGTEEEEEEEGAAVLELILALAKKLGVDDAAATGDRIALPASAAVAKEDETSVACCAVAAPCVSLAAAVASGCTCEPAVSVDEPARALG